MRCSLAWSDLSATTPVCSLFFLLRALEVRMCRANACCRTTLPVPVFLNRLDAPLWVLSLGMKIFRETKILPQLDTDMRRKPRFSLYRRDPLGKNRHSRVGRSV